jgi:hypothetical protein
LLRQIGDRPKPSLGLDRYTFPRGFWIIRVAISALLLFAAAAKGYALWQDRSSPVPLLNSQRTQLLAAEGEALIAIWLLTGFFPRTAWATTVVLFAAFCGSSLVMAIESRTSCGCAGRVVVSPWTAFAIDILVLGALTGWRPRKVLASGVAPSESRRALVTQACVAVGIAFVAGWLVHSPANPLTVEPAITDLGSFESGQGAAFRINLRNSGREPLRIFGVPSDCGCRVDLDLPFVLPAGQEQTVEVRIGTACGLSGPLQRRFGFVYTDDGERTLAVSGACSCILLTASDGKSDVKQPQPGSLTSN